MFSKVIPFASFADEESMWYKRLDFNNTVAQNLSVVAVLEDGDDVGKIVGCLLLEVANKYDPPRPMVRFYFQKNTSFSHSFFLSHLFSYTQSFGCSYQEFRTPS